MRSIRRRLFAILLVATGTVWLSAILWIQHTTRNEVGHVLDRRLEESARMVASLIARQGGLSAAEAVALATAPTGGQDGPGYLRQLSCQVWGLDGRLLTHSAGAPAQRLAGDAAGFSDSDLGGEVWRVYTHVDDELGIRVMVGDARAMRERLVNGVVMGLAGPALLLLPLLAGLIWLALARGLAPLERIARTLSGRDVSELPPLDQAAAPVELRPVIEALNGLFRRVEQARERERAFTAFAAHELKTPLAGIKTQARVAAIATDAATRDRALAQIAQGVRRTDRMVRQLLDMTAVDSGADPAPEPEDGGRLLALVVADLAGPAEARGVRLSPPALPVTGWMTRHGALLGPALRNLLENAVQASPPGAEVESGLRIAGDRAIYHVADRGPGIAAADRPHVTERFYRGRGSGQGGSGLGLAIVAVAMARTGGELRLSPREGGGLLAELRLPATDGEGGGAL